MFIILAQSFFIILSILLLKFCYRLLSIDSDTLDKYKINKYSVKRKIILLLLIGIATLFIGLFLIYKYPKWKEIIFAIKILLRIGGGSLFAYFIYDYLRNIKIRRNIK